MNFFFRHVLRKSLTKKPLVLEPVHLFCPLLMGFPSLPRPLCCTPLLSVLLLYVFEKDWAVPMAHTLHRTIDNTTLLPVSASGFIRLCPQRNRVQSQWPEDIPLMAWCGRKGTSDGLSCWI